MTSNREQTNKALIRIQGAEFIPKPHIQVALREGCLRYTLSLFRNVGWLVWLHTHGYASGSSITRKLSIIRG